MTEKKAKNSKSKKTVKKSHSLSLRIMIAAILLLALVASALSLTQSSYKGSDAWVKIPSCSTSESVRDSLISALGHKEGTRVYYFWRIMNGKVSESAGAYRIVNGQLSLKSAWRIKRGMQTPVKVSWTSLRTIDDLAVRIASKLDFSHDDFIAACDSILPTYGFDRPQYAAAFLPDTYEFYHTAPAATVVRRMLDYRNNFWNSSRTAKARELGLTPIEASTLASIVEEETAKTDEMPVVARLYINRLNRDMPLQADPTVKFAVGDPSLRRITGRHLKVESPYNTYTHKGLPPGPIRIASRQAIEKVLSAPEHEFLYMCAREDFSGYHNFAANFSEHKANAARYQVELNKRGIR